MTEVSTEAPKKRRSGWRIIGLIFLGMVLLAIGYGVWWYHDDGDLADIRQQARQQGRPLVWSDLGLPSPDAERLRLWQRVVELGKKVTTFQDKQFQLRAEVKRPYKPWDAIPEDMRAHHAALDSAMIAELVQALDQLGDQPLVLHQHVGIAQPLPELSSIRLLIRFLQERLILAEPSETGPWARRMLAACRRFTVDSLMLHLVCSSSLDVAMQGIAVRLDDLKKYDPAIADDILTTLKLQHGNLLRALDGEFLICLDLVAKPGASILSKQPEAPWYTPLVIRAGRHQALSNALDAIVQLRQQEPGTMLAWKKSMDAKIDADKAGIRTPSRIIGWLFMSGWSLSIPTGELTMLRGQVIVAEFQAKPWPIDRFDPTGAMLRPIMRDGRMIAAYSVDTDGIDHGGDAKRDRIFPLYAKP